MLGMSGRVFGGGSESWCGAGLDMKPAILIIDTALNVGLAVLAETGLSYLGFGVQRPDVSLGTLIFGKTDF